MTLAFDLRRIAKKPAAFLGAFMAAAATAAPEQILVGRIYTLDAEVPIAEAAAVQRGLFSAVGDRDSILATAGPDTQIIDLGQHVGYPGFIDAHLHVAAIGSALKRVDLTRAMSYDDIVAKMRSRAATSPRGELVLGRGWHQSKWEVEPDTLVQGFPDHRKLSAAVPDHPALLEHANGHSVLINEKAMTVLGINKNSRSPEGGVIVKDKAGHPTGILHETAIQLVAPLTRYKLDTALDYLELAQHHILSSGVTSAHDAGVTQVDLEAQRILAERGDLTLRLYSMVDGTDAGALQAWLPRGHLLASEQQRLTVRSIKIQADGALGSRTAWLHQPYSDASETSGVSTYAMDDLAALIKRTRAGSWQINVHAIGDRANSEVLKVFADALEGDRDSRFRIEHAQHLTSTDPSVFAEHGIIASMQPIHLSSDRPWAIHRLGQVRIEEGAYMWRKFLDLGVTVASGTDAPVEPVNPIADFYAAVTRKQLSGQPPGGYETGQKMGREEALHAMTMAGAIAAFEEAEKGSVAVGKYADLTVLSQDILTVPEGDLLNTRVACVIVGGDVVFRGNALQRQDQVAPQGQPEVSPAC